MFLLRTGRADQVGEDPANKALMEVGPAGDFRRVNQYVIGSSNQLVSPQATGISARNFLPETSR